jgi:hypothetical protein
MKAYLSFACKRKESIAFNSVERYAFDAFNESGDEGAIPFAGAATSAGVESPTVLPETEDERLKGVLASVPLPAPAFRTCYRFPYLWEGFCLSGGRGVFSSNPYLTILHNQEKQYVM